MSIQRWDDNEGRRGIVLMNERDAAVPLIVYVLLMVLAIWIVTRPVTAVQHVDHWPEPVAAEAGR